MVCRICKRFFKDIASRRYHALVTHGEASPCRSAPDALSSQADISQDSPGRGRVRVSFQCCMQQHRPVPSMQDLAGTEDLDLPSAEMQPVVEDKPGVPDSWELTKIPTVIFPPAAGKFGSNSVTEIRLGLRRRCEVRLTDVSMDKMERQEVSVSKLPGQRSGQRRRIARSSEPSGKPPDTGGEFVKPIKKATNGKRNSQETDKTEKDRLVDKEDSVVNEAAAASATSPIIRISKRNLEKNKKKIKETEKRVGTKEVKQEIPALRDEFVVPNWRGRLARRSSTEGQAEASNQDQGQGKSKTRRPELHMDNKFEAAKPFLCNHCPRGFNSKWERKSHELTHTEKEYICVYCDMRFVKEISLLRHSRMHKPK